MKRLIFYIIAIAVLSFVTANPDNEDEKEIENQLNKWLGCLRDKCKSESENINSRVTDDEIKSKILKLKSKFNLIPTGIKKIPDDILRIIFNKLNFMDLDKCFNVCQRWSGIAQSLEFKCLTIFNERIENRESKSYFLKEQCDPDFSVSFSDFESSKLKELLTPNLKNLKILNYDEENEIHFDIPFDINLFSSLEVLEIQNLDSKNIQTISLQNLRSLSIQNIEYKKFSIKLNTPNLQHLRTTSLENVSFVYTDKLTHLYLNSYEPAAEILKNLVFLLFKDIKTNNFRLSSFPKLETLYLGDSSSYSSEKMKQVSLRLLTEKQKLGRANLKLIFNRVLIKNSNQLDMYSSSDDLEEFIIKNYLNLDDDLSIALANDIIFAMDYSKWVNKFGKIPDDFHLKIPIKTVYIYDEVSDKDQLIQFLKGAKYLERLGFFSSLGQSFYDELMELPVEVLQITEKLDNFNFIFNLSNLISLDVEQNLPMAFFEKLTQNFSKFEVWFINNEGRLVTAKYDNLSTDANLSSNQFIEDLKKRGVV